MKELSLLENVNAVEVFSGKGLDELLNKITVEAKSIIPNLKTLKGRNEIASMAHKVAKSKTYLDGLRKDLVVDWKTKAKAVDVEGKKMRDYLDELKDEVRKPLTDWEQAEEDRINLHNFNLQEMIGGGEYSANNWVHLPAEAMKDRLREIEAESIESYEEFAPQAVIAKDKAITDIKCAIEKRETYDKEQAELEKLRAEAAAREQKLREEKLRKEGEERAICEAAEEKERERIAGLQREMDIERDRQTAIKAKEDAELIAKQAVENAGKEAEDAVIREQERVEANRIAEEIAAKKREENKAHKTKINNAVLDALVLTGLNKKQGIKTIKAIAKGEIPYTTISY